MDDGRGTCQERGCDPACFNFPESQSQVQVRPDSVDSGPDHSIWICSQVVDSVAVPSPRREHLLHRYCGKPGDRSQTPSTSRMISRGRVHSASGLSTRLHPNNEHLISMLMSLRSFQPPVNRQQFRVRDGLSGFPLLAHTNHTSSSGGRVIVSRSTHATQECSEKGFGIQVNEYGPASNTGAQGKMKLVNLTKKEHFNQTRFHSTWCPGPEKCANNVYPHYRRGTHSL